MNLAALLTALALACWSSGFAAWVSRRNSAAAERIALLEAQLAEAKEQLVSCRQVMLWFRERNELTIGALLGMLPQPKRLELLSQLGERVPPEGWEELRERRIG